MTSLELIVVVGAVVGVSVIVWLLSRQSNASSSGLDRILGQLDARLKDNVLAMNESKSFMASRVNEVSLSLGRLSQATDALHRTSEEIATFQQMLKSPKIRGSFGEVLLGNLLADVLPQDRFELQHTLPSSGYIADATIQLQDGYLVAIDAKFPLAHYEGYAAAQSESERQQQRTMFIRDVKKHVTDIAGKYISPRDKTLDYAFMYIPLEGVYYELIVHDPSGSELWDFCLSRRVVPVSPNSFLAYLETILIGLKGMKIQQQTQEILRSLSAVRHDFLSFAKEFTMIGTHLTNAKNRYDDSARRLDKFANRLEQVESSVPPNSAAELPEQSPE